MQTYSTFSFHPYWLTKKNIQVFLWILVIGFGSHIEVYSQIYSTHSKVDSVWFYDVDWNSKPDPSSCSFPTVRYFRMKYEETLTVERFIKSEIIKTDKNDWTEEDEKSFDKDYNKNSQSELDHYYEEDINDVLNDAANELSNLISSRWNNSNYSFCYNDCLVGDCYSYWEITEYKDAVLEYYYKTGFSFHENKDDKSNEVEIDLDLVRYKSTWVYFKIICSCDITMEKDYSDYITVDPDPWASVELAVAKSKPGYPFAKKFPLLPVIGLTAGAGVVSTLLIKKEDSSCDFSASAFSTESICGQANGKVTVQLSPSSDYQFLWSNGQTSQNLENIEPGSYSVTITRVATSCSLILTANVVESNFDFEVDIDVTNADCGQENGIAVVNVVPAGNYEYNWSNGNSGTMQNNLSAGVYELEVLYQGNCTKTFSIQIDENEADFILDFEQTEPHCGKDDGAITVLVEPSDSYSFQWSNGSTGNEIVDLAEGLYQVTVSLLGTDCVKIGEVELNQLTPDFEVDISSVPSNCGVSEGQLTASVNPNDIYEYQWSNGETTASISDLFSGDYQLTITLNGSCRSVFNANVALLDPEARDDFFETGFETTLEESVLDNDAGFQVQLTEVSNIIGGTINFQNDGSFTFIPDAGFSGTGGFDYIIADSCANTSTAIVEINVAGSCDFTTEFFSENASCGLSDGFLNVVVIEPGNYSYEWSNGIQGAFLYDIEADFYTVTITDLDLQCDLEFSFDLDENPADYISNIELIQPSCSQIGEIIFDANTAGIGPLFMQIEHPNGSTQDFIDVGSIKLSDYVDIVEGNYTISITDLTIGTACVESITTTIEASADALEIILEAVFPPSTPSAMDGLIILVLTNPGIAPYTIFVNGTVWGTTTEETIFIEGLSSGDYQIQILDANMCFSNEIVVTVPVAAPMSYIGIGGSFTSTQNNSIEHPHSRLVFTPGLLAGMSFPVFNLLNETELISSVRDSELHFRFQNYTTIFQAKWIDFPVTGSIGGMYEHLENRQELLWSVRLNASIEIGRFGEIEFRGALNGNNHKLFPELTSVYKFPLKKYRPTQLKSLGLTNR